MLELTVADLKLLLCTVIMLSACAGTPGRLVEGGTDSLGTDLGGIEVTDDQAVPCEPQCGGNVCGPDGCGGSCGGCEDGLPCFDGICQCSDVVWVDAENSPDPFADGTDLHPFPGLADGVAAACKDSLIFVKPGEYEGGVTLGTVGITLKGVSSASVTILSAPGEPGVVVAADGVSVKNLSLAGGGVGVSIRGQADAPLMGVELEGLKISGLAGSGCDEDTAAAGVYVEYVNAIIISDTEVSEVSGTGCGVAAEVAGISLKEVSACTIDNCAVSDVEGGSGAGISAAGIALERVEECEITGATIAVIDGGDAGDGGAGGSAAGVVLDDSADCLVGQCEILSVTGGTGTPGGRADGVLSKNSVGISVTASSIAGITGGAPNGGEADGGAGAGVQLVLAQASMVTGNLVEDVWGGAGESLEVGGSSAGIGLRDSTGLTVSGNLLNGISGGCNWLGAPAAGVMLDKVQEVTLRGNTIVGVSKDCEAAPGGVSETLPHIAVGVWARSVMPSMVVIVDTIVSATGDYCLFADPAVAGKLGAAFSTLHDCGEAQGKDATVSPECTDADPLFVAPDSGDYHLTPGSPAIDAGSLDSDYVLEPEPNGCRANQGAYGNTSEATALPGSKHCPAP